MTKILVTGAAGFIGFHVSRRLLEREDQVVGVDNLSDYYDVRLKQDRLAQIAEEPHFRFERLDLVDRDSTAALFDRGRFDTVIHLAAQVGVRYSLENPHAYVGSNLVGFFNVLEGCRQHGVKHLVFASSSSVYGANTKTPFSPHDNVDHPISLYGATKKAGELMAHAYSHLYDLPVTCLRFFTVYGPWDRPDMALCKFTRAIIEARPIDVYDNGHMQRDFTYINDVVEGVVRAADQLASGNLSWSGDAPDPGSSSAPYRIYNVGNNRPVELSRFISVLEDALGSKAQQNLLPRQPGDVPVTYADVDDLATAVGFRPNTPIEEGIARFVDWYREYYDA